MKRKQLITELDLERLIGIIDNYYKEVELSNRLDERLAQLDVVPQEKAPADLVTMNSKIKATVKGVLPVEQRIFTLVYPKGSNISEGQISVISPLGVQLLGARVGEVIAWKGHDGEKREMLVEEILYQPELNGDWEL